MHSVWKSQKKVAFNIYVYILSGQKFIKNAKNDQFWRVFENLKLAVKQCYQTGQKLMENAPESPWKSLKAPESPWKPLKAPESAWKPLKAPESPWKPLRVFEKPLKAPEKIEKIENETFFVIFKHCEVCTLQDMI